MRTEKFHYYWITIILLMIAVFIYGGTTTGISTASKEQTIKDIAFDTNKSSGYTVYLQENSGFVPYLVLTTDYDGYALLLRKEVLDRDLIYNDKESSYSSYYKDSLIDRYLNQEFLSTLEPEIQQLIPDTDITIVAESSFHTIETTVENISRKVFLLSSAEVGLSDVSYAGMEGKPLKYFKDADSRIVYKQEAQWSWWLRTPYLGTGSSMMVWAINPRGVAGERGVAGLLTEGGVRPAFCLDHSVAIEKSDKVVSGKTVYVIAK